MLISFEEALELDQMTIGLIVTKVIHSVLVAAALVGNVFECLSILKNKVLQTPVSYLLMNLAVADLIIAIFFTPRHVLEDYAIIPVA